MSEKKFHTVRGYQLLEQNKRHLTSAMEDYLEMIYRNSREEGYLRIGQLADLLNVRAPSASKMVQRLSELGLLKFRKYGIITLNENGEEIGRYLLERHRLLENFLKLLGCEENLLEQTELMEHVIKQDLLRNIQMLTDFFLENEEIMDRYLEYRRQYSNQEEAAPVN
jgi:Mn-dependent DtxR family transcriptional regulator